MIFNWADGHLFWGMGELKTPGPSAGECRRACAGDNWERDAAWVTRDG